MENKKINISFVNYFPGYKYNPSLRTPDIFSRILPKTDYDIVVNHRQPDIIISDKKICPTKSNNVVKMFHTGENYRPNYNQYDYSLAFDHSNDSRHVRVTSLSYYGLKRYVRNYETFNIDDILKQKTKFCCFLVSNPGCFTRNRFFEKLSQYKKVDSGGRYRNNIGRRIIHNTRWIKDYKFIITFENGSYPGYCTEKIGTGLKAHTIPIYWVDSTVNKTFNEKSFINCHDYSDFDKTIEQVIELDNNDEKYKQMLIETCLIDNKIPSELSDKHYINRFNTILKEISCKRNLSGNPIR